MGYGQTVSTAVLTSPRVRRRARWVLGLALAAALVAALVAVLPTRSPSIAADTPVTSKPAQVVRVPKTVPPPRRELNALLDAFVADVVAGRNLAAGWELVTPDARGSRADFLHGTTPFMHYAARRGTYHGWQLNYSYRGDVGFDVFVPPANPKAVSYAFRGEAKLVGGKWRIAVFYPQASFQPAGKTQLVYSEQDMKPNTAAQPGSGRLSPLVLLMPAAAVGAILLGALAFVGTRAVRRRARVREIERELHAQRVAEGRA
jgi:hypothetical protein